MKFPLRNFYKSFVAVILMTASITMISCSRLDGPAPVVIRGTSTPKTIEGYQVKQGDTVYRISEVTGVDLQALIDVNDLSPPYRIKAGVSLKLPTPSTYTVQHNDTLYAIAQALDTSQAELAKANRLKPPGYNIKPGQVLKIPSGYHPASRSIFAEEKQPVSQQQAERVSPASTTASDVIPTQRTALVPPKVQSSDLAPPPSGTKTVDIPPPQATIKSDRTDVTARWAAKDTATQEPLKTGVVKEKTPLPEKARPAPRSSSKFAWPVQGRVLSRFGPKENGQHNDGINIGVPRGTPVRAAENGVVVYNGNELQGFGNLVLLRHSDGWMTAYAHLDKIMVERGAKISRNQTIGSVGSTGNVETPQLHFEVRRGSRAKDPEEFLESL